jgi:hypothetical protein
MGLTPAESREPVRKAVDEAVTAPPRPPACPRLAFGNLLGRIVTSRLFGAEAPFGLCEVEWVEQPFERDREPPRRRGILPDFAGAQMISLSRDRGSPTY